MCWDCKNACCGCCWSQDFKPVPGWKATPTKIKQKEGIFIDSYIVHDCPQFEKDVVNNLKEISIQQVSKILDMKVSHVRNLTKQMLIDMFEEKGLNLEVVYKTEGTWDRRFFIIEEKHDPYQIPLEVLYQFFGKCIGYTGF